jgi:hypothetical protein
MRKYIKRAAAVHLRCTRPSTTPATVEDMKLQLIALGGLAVYFILATTFAGVLAGLLPQP